MFLQTASSSDQKVSSNPVLVAVIGLTFIVPGLLISVPRSWFGSALSKLIWVVASVPAVSLAGALTSALFIK